MVYEIPLACVFKHVGQSSRRLNDGLVEHRRNAKFKAHNSEVAKRGRECSDCTIQWVEKEVMQKERKGVARETVRIKTIGDSINQAFFS